MAGIITIFTDVLLILTAFIMLIDAIIGEKSLILTKQNLYRNFAISQMMPIENISFARWQCPIGWEEAFEDYFGGFSGGCFDNIGKQFYRENCSEKNFINATELKTLHRKDIKLWRNELICLKRFNENISFVKEIEKCPEKMKRCGKSDAFGNFLCVPEEKGCPISFINITNHKGNEDNQTFYLEIKQKDSYDDIKYLVFSNNSKYFNSNVIPIEFAVAEDLPCINSSRFSNTTYTIPLNLEEGNYGCIDKSIDLKKIIELNKGIEQNLTLKDRKFIKLDTDTLKNYLDANDLYSDAQIYFDKMKVMDKNNDVEKINISLYYRTYPGNNLTCYSNQTNLDLVKVMNDSKEYQFLLLILELVNLSTLCVFISLLALMKNNNKFLHSIVLLTKILTGSVFIYFNIVLISACYNNSLEIILYFEKYIENKCFDIDTIYLLEIYDIEGLLRTCNRYNMFLHYGSFFYGFCFFIQLVRLIYKLIKRYRRIKKQTPEAKNALMIIHNNNS